MATEFALPELGENVEKADVGRVLVAVGDVIAKDQPVVELETDKATVEVPSTVAGKVSEIRMKAGDKVKVGQVVLVVESNGAPAAAPAPSKVEAPAPSKAEASAPSKAEGGTPEASPAGTPSFEAARPLGKTAEVVDIATARQPAAAAAPAPSGASAPAPSTGRSVPAAPSVRRFARELGIDIGAVTGSGPGGRIDQDDVKQHVKGIVTGPRATGGSAHAAPPLPDFSKWGAVDVKPMSNIRRKTAEHLSAAWQAPHVTQHDKADVTALDEFRKTYGARVEKAGGKLTVTAIVIKILASAIDRYPQFASSPDMANETLIFKQYRHIGVAVDTPNGLLVPVIRDVNRKTVTEIAVELATLSQKARDKKLSLDDMSGGVLSVTNLGGIGGTSFTPIVNMPEVAILGMSRTATEPVWNPSTRLGAGEFVPRQMLPLSLSYDHRVIDGADAARFLRFVVEGLEQPLTMIL